MLVIFVGDTGSTTEQYARSLHPNAKLINEHNHTNFDGIGYTSLGEFKNQKNFFNLLDRATQLHYVPSDTWSDFRNGTSSLKQNTENLLMFFYGRKEVLGLEHLRYYNPECDSLVAQRQTTSPQLWVSGGTITHGEEIEIDHKYGSLLAVMLNMPVSFVCKNSADPDWCADQLLRSNIQSGDTVVWELTESSNINQSLILIEQCVSTMQRIGCRLILVGLEDMNMVKYFFNLPNYMHLYGQFGTFFKAFPDKDSSTLWPGPITHKWYANEIYKRFFL